LIQYIGIPDTLDITTIKTNIRISKCKSLLQLLVIYIDW